MGKKFQIRMSEAIIPPISSTALVDAQIQRKNKVLSLGHIYNFFFFEIVAALITPHRVDSIEG